MNLFKKEPDFLAIGDITIDAFIRIKDAEVTCSVDRTNCILGFRFGDKVPFEDVTIVPAVGNSPNAAVSAARLGLSSSIITNLGNDHDGQACIDSLKKGRVDTSYVKVHKGVKTNYHYVLWYENERTILIKHEVFPYSLPKVSPKWVYLSSLGETSADFHDEIADWLEKEQEIKLAFQPGTFQMKLGKERLSRIYKRSEIIFCNTEEAHLILGLKEKVSHKELLTQMHVLGPRLVVVTDGPKGAYAYDGEKMWFVPVYPEKEPAFERTGAGDAFSSTVASALALGKTFEEALLWGPINSMSVVGKIGAQEGLLPRGEVERFIKEAPAEYALKAL